MIATVLFAASFLADGSSASESGIPGTDVSYVYDGDGAFGVSAGGTEEFTLIIFNKGMTAQAVKVSAEGGKYIDVVPAKPGVQAVDPQSYLEVLLRISADRYTTAGSYSISVTVAVLTAGGAADTFGIGVEVSSALTSDKYNKFLGWFDNDLGGVLGEVWFTALVSFLGLLALGYAVAVVAIPLCTRIILRKDEAERKVLEKLLFRMSQIVIWLWVVGQIFRIVGADESVIDLVNKLFYFAYVVIGVVVGWHLYKLVVDLLIKKSVESAEGYEMEEKRMDFESFRPLFMYLGEIAIAIVSVMVVMNLLGFNLTAIITSAGLVSLGISMGAQDVLKQFFAGLEILATRPFKAGDIIKVGDDQTVFVVRKVNVMNTFLANWENTDINVMPNSTITTSKIQNMTRETRLWRVYMQVQVSYRADAELAKRLLLEAVEENPRIVTDGSAAPFARVDALGEDNMVLKTGFTVRDYNYQYSVSGEVRQAVMRKFSENGLDIDYSKIVVHRAEGGAVGKIFGERTAEGAGR